MAEEAVAEAAPPVRGRRMSGKKLVLFIILPLILEWEKDVDSEARTSSNFIEPAGRGGAGRGAAGRGGL